MSSVKKSILTAICIALCVVLPQAFHAIPNAGTIFAPMHIPVLLCGLSCGGGYGLLCGLAGPLLSSVLTGMPPAAILPSMVAECVVYGGLSGLLLRFIRTGKELPDFYLAMVPAMLAGRVIGGLLKAFIFSKGSYSLQIWTTSYFVTALPAVLLQLALIPGIMYALIRANLIPARYIREEAE